MEEMMMPPEILDHARGAMTFDNAEVVQMVARVGEYQCKIYRARLDLASASQHARQPLVIQGSRK
jgi:hypothetical protein